MYPDRRNRLLFVFSLWISSFWLPGGAAPTTSAAEPWATFRGNVARTGNTDNQPGPATPRVRWVFKSQEHFVAAPVPSGDRLFISGLGAFNVATVHCLAVEPGAAKRTVWSKSTPYLKLPTVSSPAVADGVLVFGDGMHQTDGATLHCLRADGRPLWQAPEPGTLVHLEGAPTVADGRVYVGGGAAGVLCVDLNRAVVGGKEYDRPALAKLLDTTWADLLAKYEEEKKKDPCFAVEPTEDKLPRAAPVRHWQQGKDRWHVDAPVTVVGDRVLACSAYLDKERVGDRVLACLDAKTGQVRWQVKPRLNPWGGASVAGDRVVLGGSTIGYYPQELKAAKGEVAAYDLADGTEKWRKEVPGGVVSCVALADGLAVATATDGKVRAFDLADGALRWSYDAKAALFAPAAVAGGMVYVGDLNGVVHAVDLRTGAGRWVLDLGRHPDVQAPGMIYGGPVVHGGRLFVATCNLEGPFARQPTVVVCISEQ